MLDLAGLGQLLTGVGTVGTMIYGWKVNGKLKMSNGTTIANAVEDTHRMTKNAEPHHRVVPIVEEDTSCS